jgi:hypothetical protein
VVSVVEVVVVGGSESRVGLGLGMGVVHRGRTGEEVVIMMVRRLGDDDVRGEGQVRV